MHTWLYTVSAHTDSDMVTTLQSVNKNFNCFQCLIKYNAIMNFWSMVPVKAILYTSPYLQHKLLSQCHVYYTYVLNIHTQCNPFRPVSYYVSQMYTIHGHNYEVHWSRLSISGSTLSRSQLASDVSSMWHTNCYMHYMQLLYKRSQNYAAKSSTNCRIHNASLPYIITLNM